MVARLVYLVDGQEIELEKMSLDALDDLTYSAFGTEEDIINSLRYEKLLDKVSKDGEVKVAYDALEVPLKTIDYVAGFGFDPFHQQVQYMSVLVGDRKIGPTLRSLRENIIRTLSDIDVVQDFYEIFKDKYNAKERLYYSAGMLYENDKLVFDGIRRIVDEATNHSEGYLAGRIFIDGLSKLDSVKNKDEKGRIVSPKVYEKK